MNKKSKTYIQNIIILICFICSFLLTFFVGKDITYISDITIDENNNIYCMDLLEDKAIIYKLSLEGKYLDSMSLDYYRDDIQAEYYQLQIDNGKVYVTCIETMMNTVEDDGKVSLYECDFNKNKISLIECFPYNVLYEKVFINNGVVVSMEDTNKELVKSKKSARWINIETYNIETHHKKNRLVYFEGTEHFDWRNVEYYNGDIFFQDVHNGYVFRLEQNSNQIKPFIEYPVNTFGYVFTKLFSDLNGDILVINNNRNIIGKNIETGRYKTFDVFSDNSSIKGRNFSSADIKSLKIDKQDNIISSLSSFNGKTVISISNHSKVQNIDRIYYFRHSKLFILAVLLMTVTLLIIIKLVLGLIKILRTKKVSVVWKTAGVCIPVCIIILLCSFYEINSYMKREYIIENTKNIIMFLKTFIDGIKVEDISKMNNVYYGDFHYGSYPKYANIEDINIDDYSQYVNKCFESKLTEDIFKNNVLYTDNINVYKISDDKKETHFYNICSSNHQSYIPIEYIILDKDMKKFQEISKIKYKDSSNGEYYSIIDTYRSNRRIQAVLVPLYNDTSSDALPVGIVEIHISISSTVYLAMQAVKRFEKIVIVLMTLVAAINFILLLISIIPLQYIKNKAIEFTEGNTLARIVPKSCDETRILGEKINRFADDMMENIRESSILSESYLKYLPKQIFELLGRKDIVEIELGDKQYINATEMLLYCSSEIFLEPFSKATKDFFEKVIPIVGQNNGFVEHYNDNGFYSIFSQDNSKCLNCAIDIHQLLNISKVNSNTFIALNYTTILLSIIGNDNKMSTAILSENQQLISELTKLAKKLNIKVLITENVINNINDFKEKFSSRFIGEYIPQNKKQILKLYDVYDGDLELQKNLKRITQNLFEEAISLYMTSHFKEAYEMFSKVLEKNPEDKISIYYLYKCNDYINNGLEGEVMGIEM